MPFLVCNLIFIKQNVKIKRWYKIIILKWTGRQYIGSESVKYINLIGLLYTGDINKAVWFVVDLNIGKI